MANIWRFPNGGFDNAAAVPPRVQRCAGIVYKTVSARDLALDLYQSANNDEPRPLTPRASSSAEARQVSTSRHSRALPSARKSRSIFPASAICARRTALAMFAAGLFQASGCLHSPTWLPSALALAAMIIGMVRVFGGCVSNMGACNHRSDLSSWAPSGAALDFSNIDILSRYDIRIDLFVTFGNLTCCAFE